jgi:hypothetical protein
MRVSLVQCVSTAIEMLEFSTNSIIQNSGHDDFDYVVVTWLPSLEVSEYLESLQAKDSRVKVVKYQTCNEVGYVPNLRNMMNTGFTKGFELNDYVGLVNTDMYFGLDWLINLVKHVAEDRIVSSLHFSRTRVPHHPQADLGETKEGLFDHEQFNKLYDQHFSDQLDQEDPSKIEDWRRLQTMPYLFHRKWWELCGPWELRKGKPDTPDVRFFRRCKSAGAEFCLSRSSIAYHMEAAERRGRRPVGAEQLPEE